MRGRARPSVLARPHDAPPGDTPPYLFDANETAGRGGSGGAPARPVSGSYIGTAADRGTGAGSRFVGTVGRIPEADQRRAVQVISARIAGALAREGADVGLGARTEENLRQVRRFRSTPGNSPSLRGFGKAMDVVAGG